MKKSTLKKFIALILCLSMTACLFAGCAGEQNDTPTGNTGNDTPGTNDAVVDTDSGYQRDKVVCGISADGGTFDPYAGFTNWGMILVGDLMFQHLIRVDSQGEIHYELAKSVEKVDDLTYTITLWDCIYDSMGNQLTANDVVWSIQKFVDGGNSGGVNRLDYVEATSDYVVTWHCKQAFDLGELEKNMSNPTIVVQASYEACGNDMTTTPVGTGPYVLTAYTPGSGMTFTANENFWMNNLPEGTDLWVYDQQNVREIEMMIIQDAASRAIALEMGTVDVVDSMNAIDVQKLTATDAFNSVDQWQDAPCAFIFNCNEISPCSDVNLRKAICYAIDNAGIVNALDCPAQVVYGLQPRMYDAPESWTTGEGRDYYNYDLEKAKSYLEASDYNGEKVVIMYSSSVVHDGATIMVQAALKAIGIDAELYAVDASVARSAKTDPTQWDIAFDTMGGGNYLNATLKNFTSFDHNDLKGQHPMLIDKDETLDNLYYAIAADNSEENANAWDAYFTGEQCYAYAICIYANQTACAGDIEMALGSKNFLCPNASTYEAE